MTTPMTKMTTAVAASIALCDHPPPDGPLPACSCFIQGFLGLFFTGQARFLHQGFVIGFVLLQELHKIVAVAVLAFQRLLGQIVFPFLRLAHLLEQIGVVGYLLRRSAAWQEET